MNVSSIRAYEATSRMQTKRRPLAAISEIEMRFGGCQSDNCHTSA
jgi:hypothetical protein